MASLFHSNLTHGHSAPTFFSHCSSSGQSFTLLFSLPDASQQQRRQGDPRPRCHSERSACPERSRREESLFSTAGTLLLLGLGDGEQERVGGAERPQFALCVVG